jgi:uncharacterized iron-regulated membrane protein
MIVGLLNAVAVLLIVGGGFAAWRIRRRPADRPDLPAHPPQREPARRRINSVVVEGVATAVGILAIVVSVVIAVVR